ncbi:MAG TPA: SsrA-binding protein SmpB [Patescibacteria group bacterium]|jgi:SsrA-binding protein|nr:SsrA-binding protein SmpB [Patescibacteria group bacterium]
MAKKKTSPVKRIVNRRAKFDYELDDSIVVGLQLTGAETKALRMGQGQLRGAYVTVKNDELWLVNSMIAGGKGILITETDKTRARKLLAKRKEIDSLVQAKQQGRTIVPLEILSNRKFIKLRISVGKGKKLYDKRLVIKKRDEQRKISSGYRIS